jgi:hypothetical protein
MYNNTWYYDSQNRPQKKSIQKMRGNVKIEGKFRAPIRNTCKLAKPISQNCDHLGQK